MRSNSILSPTSAGLATSEPDGKQHDDGDSRHRDQIDESRRGHVGARSIYSFDTVRTHKFPC